MPQERKRYVEARVDGRTVRVVDPAHFYAAPCADARKGRGLFCRVDLEPGECWWAHDFADRRYVERVMSWSDYLRLDADEKRAVETLCYIDVETRSLVACSEPFTRVNHASRDANSTSDHSGNSVVTLPIPAGTEITLFYDYEPVLSILWKFPALRDSLPREALADETFLFSPAVSHDEIREFLQAL